MNDNRVTPMARIKWIIDYVQTNGVLPHYKTVMENTNCKDAQAIRATKNAKAMIELDLDFVSKDMLIMLKKMMENHFEKATNPPMKVTFTRDGDRIELPDEYLGLMAAREFKGCSETMVKLLQELGKIQKVPELIETYNESVNLDIDAESIRRIYEQIKHKRCNRNGNSE